MRLCTVCGNKYPDDANFCPMDASRLDEPRLVVASAPVRAAAASTDLPAVPTQPTARGPATLVDQPAPIGGRFALTEAPECA